MAALVGLPFSPLQWEELWLALASVGSAREFSPVEARKLQLLSMLVGSDKGLTCGPSPGSEAWHHRLVSSRATGMEEPIPAASSTRALHPPPAQLSLYLATLMA